MIKKKKWIKIVLIVLICAILFFPVPTWYKDGGTVKYMSITSTIIQDIVAANSKPTI